MRKKSTENRINNLIELRKNFWGTLTLLAGALAGLALTFGSLKFNLESYIRIILIILGIAVEVFLFHNLGKCNIAINKLLNQLDEE